MQADKTHPCFVAEHSNNGDTSKEEEKEEVVEVEGEEDVSLSSTSS